MSKFDKDLNVDDLIVSCHKGIHRVVKIERRFFTKEDERYKYGKAGDEYSSRCSRCRRLRRRSTRRSDPRCP